ncbi:MAG: hypothetical protein DMD86_08850 [Candidatus Rokuibacteriota bacterium]|nr:MAG: hypothetical protein DMD86_08850 [Candidatus Rokubacteria bacterium]
MVTRADLRRSRIDPRQPRFRAMLDGLQANILKAGGRDHAVYLCFRVRPGMADRARRWIRDFATRRMTSAREQLAEAAAHRRRKAAGRPIVNFFLSAKGYRALGARLELPGDPRFRAGMKRARARLKDPPPAAWEHGYRGDVHAAILLNDARAARLARQAERVRRELGGFATVLTVERGRVWRDARHEPIEHFGYVDGRSQPLFLKPDIDKEKKREGIGPRRWGSPTRSKASAPARSPSDGSRTAPRWR